MTARALQHIDTNLLVTLDVLLETRSVTGASERLGLTQPAVSQALGRIRSLLDDPILVRQGAKMVPTPRADALAGPLRRVLADLQALIADQPDFDHATSNMRFVVAVNDYVASVILPHLVAHLNRVAPGIDLVCRAIPPDMVGAALGRGEFDLAIGVLTPGLAGVRSAELFEESYVCLLRCDHRLAGGEGLNLDNYIALDHLLVSPRGRCPGGPVDRALAASGRARRVAVEVPFFTSALRVVESTDLVLTIPSRMANVTSARVVVRVPPVELNTFPLTMHWHERYDREPALRWLREQVLMVTADL